MVSHLVFLVLFKSSRFRSKDVRCLRVTTINCLTPIAVCATAFERAIPRADFDAVKRQVLSPDTRQHDSKWPLL